MNKKIYFYFNNLCDNEFPLFMKRFIEINSMTAVSNEHIVRS